MKRLGSHFADELRAAGLATSPIVWSEDGEIHIREDVGKPERDLLAQVIAAHDPLAEPIKLTRIQLFAQLDTATNLSQMRTAVKQLLGT